MFIELALFQGGHTALMLASSVGDVPSVRVLIGSGAVVDMCNEVGWLHHTAVNSVSNILIARGSISAPSDSLRL